MTEEFPVKRRSLALLCGMLVMGLWLSAAWAADELTGTWAGQINDPMTGKHDIVLRLKVEDGKIAGTLSGGPGGAPGAELLLTDIKLQGDQLSFKAKGQGFDGEVVLYPYKGTVAGNRIHGTHEAPFGPVPWEVTRK